MCVPAGPGAKGRTGTSATTGALRTSLMWTPRPMNTSAGPPRGRGPAWERPGARPSSSAPVDDLAFGDKEQHVEQVAERAGGEDRRVHALDVEHLLRVDDAVAE